MFARSRRFFALRQRSCSPCAVGATPRRIAGLVRRSGSAQPPTLERLEERRLLANVLVVAEATLIEDGEDLAREFGYEQVGESARVREFVIANVGLDPFDLSDLQAPAGFRITQDIAHTTLASGETTTFRMSLDPNATPGQKAGDVVFLTSDADGTTTFNFAVEGTLTAAGGPRVVGFAPDKTGGFWVDFDEALDPDTISTDSVRAFTAGDDGQLGTDDDAAVAGTVDYVAERRQIRFTPDSAVGEDYRVELLGTGDSSITALGGEVLDGEYFGTIPTGNGTAGGNFEASVGVDQRTDVARFDTVFGIIDVSLTPDITPITVNNFYRYADDGDWDMSFIHRSVQNFIIQGGGFYFENGAAIEIDAHGPIQNEFQQGITSNTRGTIAMAKLGGDPDSATNQWFFNLIDNSDNLDAQNGGFTTFGEIISATGLEVMDHIASLDTVNAGGAFANLPLRDIEANIDNDNLVVMQRISSLVDFTPVAQGAVWEVVLDDGNETPAPNVDFGDLAANQQQAVDLLVVNRGTENVTITLAQGLTAPFSMTPANGQGDQDDWILAPGESFSFTITFAPAASGVYADQLVLQAPGASPDSFTIDLAGSALPATPTSVQLAPAYDTGQSNADGVTQRNNGSVDSRLGFVVTGVESGATVTIYANDVAIGTGVVPDGETSLTVLTDGQTQLLDGIKQITATQEQEGAVSAATAPLAITIDAAAPTLTGGDDAAVTQGAPVSIDLNSDDETDELDPVYALTQAPAGATIDPGTGVISWTPTGADVGENAFTATVTDVAGNVRTAQFTLTVLPLAPSPVDLASGSDTGLSNTDNITNRNNSGPQSAMSFRVDAVIAGATVRIYAGSTLIGEGVVADGSDTIFITTNGTAALADGTYQVTATQTVNGFTSNASAALAVEIDAFAPIIEPLDSFSVSAGQPFDADLESDDEAAEKPVIYSLPAAPSGATIDPATGLITWTPLDSQVGVQQFTAAATDIAGNVAEEQFEVEVVGTGLGEDGLTFNSNLAGKGSERHFIVEPTLTGAFILSMDGIDPAAKIDVYNQATGEKVAKPGKTKANKGLPASTSFLGTAGVTYEIVVKAKGNAVGAFVLDVAHDPDGRFQDAAEIPADLVDLGDEGNALRFVANGDVDSLLDRDFYTFTPTSGGETVFTFQSSGGLEGEMVVYTNNGGVLDKMKKRRDKNGAGTDFTTTLATGVEYVVEIASIKGRSSGAYALLVEVDSNSSFASPAPLGDFAGDMTIDGELLHKKDDDWFSFTPTVSGALLYDMTAGDGMKMKLTFVDAATGERLDRSTGKGGSLPFGRFEITAGREVRVLAEAKGNSSGNYSIDLSMDDFGAASSADNFELTLTPMGSEIDGLTGAVGGEISSNLDQDFFAFTAPAGYTSGFFGVTATTGDLTTFATLYAEQQNGELSRVGRAKDKGDGAEMREDLTPGTTYYLAIESHRGRSTGEYAIEVELDGNDSPAGADDSGDLTLDPLAVTGKIQHKKDADWFVFTPQVSGAVLYDMTGDAGMKMKLTFLDAATGERLDRSTGKGGSLPFGRFEVTADRDVLILAEGKGRSTGNYAINLMMDDLGAASAADDMNLTVTAISSEVDGMIANLDGEISSQLDRDFYTFTAPASYETGYFNVSGASPDLVASATLYESVNGGLDRIGKAKDKGDGAEIREDLSAGEDYYLVVESHRGKSTGAYTVDVELDGNSSPVIADGLGTVTGDPTPLAGEIIDRKDVDVFAFTAGATGTFTMDNFVGGGSIRPKVTVYADDGSKLARGTGSTDSFDPLTVQVAEGERYFLEVQTRGNNPGTYNFDLHIA